MKNLTISEKLLAIRMVILMFLNTIWRTLTGRIVIVLLIVFVPLFTLRACMHSPQPARLVVQQEEQKVSEPYPTVDQALDAVVRTVGADKVCYDSKQKSYYMHWTGHPLKDDEDEREHQRERSGWYAMTDVTMYLSANDTWYIKDVDSIPDIYVGVDVTGLPCKPGRGQ